MLRLRPIISLMKAVFKQIVLGALRALAKRKLAVIRPKVIGITGSVGKTTTKEAVYSIVSRRFKTVKSQKSYNSDFGVVLTILGKESGFTSPSKWISILIKCLIESFKKPEHFDVLILEMGVDKPGNMSEILKVVKPDIMVFLNVKDVHRSEGQFPNKEAIFEEKSKACVAVPDSGWVILNADDMYASQLYGKLPANTLSVGVEEKDANIRAKHVKTETDGLHFTLCYEDKEIKVHLPNVLGEYHVPLILSAIATGFLMEVPWKTISAGLHEFELPQGRMNKIDGKNGSLILDSSYNASPDTMEAALKVLGMFGGRKIAALGTMNELGELTESAHIKIGKVAAEYSDMLIAVGEHCTDIAEGAHRAGMSASMIHNFRNSKEAGEFLGKMLERGDVLLVKGSQNKVRMEKVVKACMRDPEKARQLLVRQEPYWLTHG